jgi:hypothetical protein
MRKHLIRAMAAASGVALIVAASALAAPEVVQVGNLVIRDNGGISPTRLPRNKQVPISANLNGMVRTTDGSHPPAVTSLNVDFDKTIHINAKGLPACKESKLVAQSTVHAKRVCGDAIVGEGSGEVQVAFPEQKPIMAKGPVILFNGGIHGGKTLVLAHTYVSIPAPTAVVVSVELSHIHRGHFGTHMVAEIPKIAGGYGSITKAHIKVDRKFTYKGKRQSYLTASCPTGHYFTEGEVHFADGTTIKLFHDLPCTPVG